jgi:PAS domain S-box-containing protein
VSDLRKSQNETAETEPSSELFQDLLATGSPMGELAAAFLSNLSSSRKSEASSSASKAMAALSEASEPSLEARYRVLVEQIPAVVFMAYLDGGLGEAYVSPHIERTLGFSQEEWLDDPIRWYQQIHPEDRARWSIEAAETFTTGRPLKSIYRVLAADGRIVWFRCEAALVRRHDGQPWFIHGVGFDITDLKETELALQRETAERERLQKLELERQIAKTEQTESRLAAIVQSSEDAIIGKTLDGTITSWNAAATRLYGYERDEILGKSVRILMPPELQDEETQTLQIIASGQGIAHQESQHIRKNGERFYVARTLSPIKNAAGQVMGVSTIARDITQNKRIEDKLRVTEKLAATGRLAATIAHEINNPLESVTNLLYLAQRDPSSSPKLRQYLKTADEELDRVAQMAKQTLGFYRDSTLPTRFDAAKTIRDVLAIYDRRAAGWNVTIKTELDGDCQAFGFAGEFRQVVSNLIANALDAMSGTGGRLLIRARKSHNLKDGTERLRISIADTGTGISVEQREKVFEAFFTTKSHFGTGLGLWLSRGILQKHGGSIRLRSSVAAGRSGTVVSLFWPLKSNISANAESAA